MFGTMREFVNLKTKKVELIKSVGRGFYLHHGINVLKTETLRALGLVPATDALKRNLGIPLKK